MAVEVVAEVVRWIPFQPQKMVLQVALTVQNNVKSRLKHVVVVVVAEEEEGEEETVGEAVAIALTSVLVPEQLA